MVENIPDEASEETRELIEKAGSVFKQNFPATTWFGRCIFLSWYCEKGSCKFCFRSTTKHQIKFANNARRSLPSILTDAIMGKNLGWKIEFLTGGYGIFEFDEIVLIAKYVSEIYGEKIWVNLGALKKKELEQLRPYVKGVCASIETIEPDLHDSICPDKPIEPYSKMLDIARDLGFKTSITIVVGLGEKKEDFELLSEYIDDHNIGQITFYALKPVKDTQYTESPDPDYYAWWIAKTRIRFPKLKIMAGLTPKRPDYAKIILEAGANAITKFPVIKKFNSEESKNIELMAKSAGREFEGSLTKLPPVDWDVEVDRLGLNEALAKSVKTSIAKYLNKMSSTNE
ncbi:radical SAM protein [Thermoproteota archaeon]